jgi:Fe-Mn family superoxide dismutase
MDVHSNAPNVDPAIQSGRPMEPAMALALIANFGSVENWRESFAALAYAADTRHERVALAFRGRDSTLVNLPWVEGSETAADAVPILVIDPHERAARVADMIADIDWADVYARYRHAVHALSEPFAATQDDLAGALLVDVRRAGVFEQAATMIPGARWRDPARVAEWSAELPPGREVIVYCVYGHEVGRATAMRLRAAGRNARFLSGGIDGWQAAGRPLQPKGTIS